MGLNSDIHVAPDKLALLDRWLAEAARNQ